MRSVLILSVLVVVAGCATYLGSELDRRFGQPDPARFDHPPPPIATDAKWSAAKDVLDKRCVVCHSCYDAPCQLDLGSYEGVARGARKSKVYDAARLVADEPSRLFIDATTTAAWREKGFYPVLNEREPSVEGNREGGVMYRLLALKRAHPLPGTPALSVQDFDLSLDRAQRCPSVEEMDGFEASAPLWGMPYALPGLSEAEHRTLSRWIETGAPAGAPAPLTAQEKTLVAQWEEFLNRDDLKTQLMSRYLYEHLFLGNLYFEGVAPTHYFRLVRSSTAPGHPVEPVITRRPYDDPGVSRVYYRLMPWRSTIVAKTHLPYALSPARRLRWEELFLRPEYAVEALPLYSEEVGANPFIAFRDLPLEGRYRFLLDDAQFFIMGFIKGPVCRGQVALNVINDRFWVLFLAPTQMHAAETAQFLAQESKHLYLPAAQGSTSLVLTPWLRYSHLQRRYLEARSRFLQEIVAAEQPISLDVVWDGDGRNPNAALTVLRHFDSASVVQGLVGKAPKTAWLISYPLFERIHYLLVSGFDVYGNAGHQLNTRLYMDFLRMEGEFNFLALLPRAVREKERDQWYRDAPREVSDFIQGQYLNLQAETEIPFRTAQPKNELYALLQTRLSPVLNMSYDLAREADPALREPLARMATVSGRAAALMPETAFLSVTSRSHAAGPEAVFTILRDSAHLNLSHFLDEEKVRVPAEDTLTVARGVVGAYPNVFYRVAREDLSGFVDAVASLTSEADYSALLDRFAVRRTDSRFWAHSDAVHEVYRAAEPVASGVLDYSRLENR